MSSVAEPSDEPDSTSALQLVTRILVSARELERRFDSSLADHGLNLTRADVLDFIARQGDGGCAQTELASALRLSESNICTLVERMRVDGWLLRLRSGLDRRRSVIVLTPRARQSLENLRHLRETRTAEWLRGMSPDELHELNGLLDRMLAALRDDQDSSADLLRASLPIPAETLRRAS